MQPQPQFVYDPNMAPVYQQPPPGFQGAILQPMGGIIQQPIPPRQGATCRICQFNDGQEDIIRPCNCTGAQTYVHRGCLNRWRVISPFPDALYKCEFCNTPFSLIYMKKKDTCQTRSRAVAIFISSFLGILALALGLWMLCGFIVDRIINNPAPWTFLVGSTLWQRIFFYGFVLFFALLGIVGSIFFCCSKKKGKQSHNGYEYSDHNDCYWVCCGPSYHRGSYYGSPFGYWSIYDVFCCYLCCVCTPWEDCCTCTCNDCMSGLSCGACNGDCNCDGGDAGGDAGLVIVVVLLIILAILVTIGVIFGSLVVFMLMNKIVRRQLSILDRKDHTAYELVADLDDPKQVGEARSQAEERLVEAGGGPVSAVPAGASVVKQVNSV